MTERLMRDIVGFFSLLLETIRLLGRVVVSIKGLQSFDFDRLVEETNAGNLNYGDKVTVNAIFSDFVPVARKLLIPIEDVGALFDPLPCRPFSVNGCYCALLQSFDSKFAADPKGFPLFYSDSTSRPIMPTLSGLTVEVKGTLMSIPSEWKRLLDLKRPVCVKANSIEIIGAEKATFGTFLWAVGKSNEPFLKPSAGVILAGDPFWWYNNRLGNSNSYFMVNGGTSRTRHGNVNQKFDTIRDFYGVNLLDESQYEKHKSALEARAKRLKIDAQFDMTTLSTERTKWLRQRIGL